MIIKMKKISVVGPKSDLKTMIDALKSTNCFEHANARNIGRDTETDNKYRETLTAMMNRTKSVIDFEKKCREDFLIALKKHNSFNNRIEARENAVSQYEVGRLKAVNNNVYEIGYKEFKEVVERETEIVALIEKLELLNEKIAETNAVLSKNKSLITELKPYINLEVKLNMLHDTNRTFVLAGLIQQDMLLKFKSDFNLDTIISSEYKSGENKVCAVFIGLQEDYPIINPVYEYGFERCKLTYEANAKDKISEIEEQNIKLYYELLGLLNSATLCEEDIKLLKCYYDYLKNEVDTENVMEATLKTQENYILNGWIVANEQAKIENLIKQTSARSTVKIEKPTKRDNPPTLVVNKALIAPYESITNMYSPPSSRDLDPNIFVAFFYFMFFGVMIGDIGYGLIMFVVALIVLLALKPKKATKNLIMIICMGGISAVLWGFFFGSVFGITTTGSDGSTTTLIPAVIDPIKDSLVFLLFSLGLGVVQIIFGLMLKFYNLLRHGRIIDAICDAGIRLALFAGLILFACGMFLDGAKSLYTPGIYTIIVSVGLLFLTAGRKNKGLIGKLSGGFGGIYSLVNYFSDIISYARLFGLGLVGSVIAMVANIMAQTLFGIPVVGIPLGILVAVLFHVLNLAIGILSAYVHNARLQFVEFFGKFYEGNGRNFIPLGGNTKYVKIKSILSNKKG